MTRSTRSGSCSPDRRVDHGGPWPPRPAWPATAGLAVSVGRPRRCWPDSGRPKTSDSPPWPRAPTGERRGRRASSSVAWPAVPDSLSASTTGAPARPAADAVAGRWSPAPATCPTGRRWSRARALAADPSASVVRDREADRGRPPAAAGTGAVTPTSWSVLSAPAGTTSGIFESAGHGWRAGRDRALPGAKAGPTEVIRLDGIPGGASALVSAGTRHAAPSCSPSGAPTVCAPGRSPAGFPLGRTP